MKSKLDAFVDFFVEYWVMILGVSFIIIMAVGMSMNLSDASKYRAKANKAESQLVGLKAELKTINKKNAKDVSKKVKTDGINATNIGNKLVAAEKNLVSIYLKRGQITKEDRDTVSDAGAVITETTGETPGIDTMWLRNTQWTLKLNTVVTYSDTTMPVLFTMSNTKGDMMGIVTARYDSTVNKFTDISVQYTNAGMKDFQNITTNN